MNPDTNAGSTTNYPDLSDDEQDFPVRRPTSPSSNITPHATIPRNFSPRNPLASTIYTADRQASPMLNRQHSRSLRRDEGQDAAAGSLPNESHFNGPTESNQFQFNITDNTRFAGHILKSLNIVSVGI
jgi:hypothetical protein